MALEKGIHNIPAAQYHADPCPQPSLSAGIAHRLLSQSPKHAWFAHPRLNPHHVEEENSDFDLGSCAHAVLLEGEKLIEPIDPANFAGKRGAIPKGWTNDAIREARDQARARGQIPVLLDKLAEIRAMADKARAALASCELGAIDLTGGRAEQSLIWQEGAAWCRARPDWLRADLNFMLDYKSTAGSANPSHWIRNQMIPLGFDLQAVHYCRGLEANGGAMLPQWIFLVQENYAPYECSFVSLAPAQWEIAKRKWDFAMTLWDNCLSQNRWNGYGNRVHYAEPMAWQIAEDEERKLDLAIERGGQA